MSGPREHVPAPVADDEAQLLMALEQAEEEAEQSRQPGVARVLRVAIALLKPSVGAPAGPADGGDPY